MRYAGAVDGVLVAHGEQVVQKPPDAISTMPDVDRTERLEIVALPHARNT